MRDPKVSLGEVIAPRRMVGTGESSEQSPSQADLQTLERAAAVQYECHDCQVLVASGAYDMYSIKPLADALGTAAGKHPKVVLEASSITFAGATFLNLLILTRRATDLRVAAPTQQVQRLLEITGVDTILKVRATVEEAATC
ncbi:STAS domain-containing protein [Streptomyces sp. NBC_00638]|uniref:STAS domain-containing protein n=1 Tax=unclassified Streptomyces TaxID=2593676 RepID=UPI00225662DB|nr:STAS domain-containing protein [Streptomyces sp. NBC_00638]MCX5008591.1 STAS domain-containing protein [Streptomyces sp. NBC_00638]